MKWHIYTKCQQSMRCDWECSVDEVQNERNTDIYDVHHCLRGTMNSSAHFPPRTITYHIHALRRHVLLQYDFEIAFCARFLRRILRQIKKIGVIQSVDFSKKMEMQTVTLCLCLPFRYWAEVVATCRRLFKLTKLSVKWYACVCT